MRGGRGKHKQSVGNVSHSRLTRVPHQIRTKSSEKTVQLRMDENAQNGEEVQVLEMAPEEANQIEDVAVVHADDYEGDNNDGDGENNDKNASETLNATINTLPSTHGQPKGKKRKKPDTRHFQERWTECFGFIEVDGRALCVFCQETVVRRTYSVQRHYKTLHDKQFKDEAERKESIDVAIAAIRMQGEMNTANKEQLAEKDEKDYATEASFTLSLCISEKGKPFTEGEFIKSVFLACAENLFEDFNNKELILARIKDIPASARTMQRRMADMASDVRNQQSVNLAKCDAFSIAVADTVDASSDSHRLTVFVRYVTDAKIHEDLCFQKVIDKPPLTGEDVLDIVVQHFEQRGVDVTKIASIMTDGSSILTSKPSGFVQLLQDKVKHAVISSPCILRQEELCTQISGGDLKRVMEVVIKVVNLIASRPPNLQDTFQGLLAELEKVQGDLSPRNTLNVGWLGNGKLLDCFIANLEDIRSFFGEKWQTYPELWNDFWVLKLSFLADLIGHLNDLNSRLQCRGQTIEVLYEQFKLFTSKISVFRRDIQMAAFRYFAHVRNFFAAKGSVDIQSLDSYVAALEQAFYTRFQDLHAFGSMFSFIVRAEEFIDVNFESSFLTWLRADNLEMELLELKVSDLWCSKLRDLRKALESQDGKPERESAILECWLSLPDKFASMKKVAITLLTLFGSTYCTEQTLAYLKTSFNPLRSRLSMINSETSARLKMTNYKPNVKKLCTEIIAQGSH